MNASYVCENVHYANLYTTSKLKLATLLVNFVIIQAEPNLSFLIIKPSDKPFPLPPTHPLSFWQCRDFIYVNPMDLEY